MTDDLRQRIADAIERDAERPAAEREGIIPAVLAIVQPELDRLSEYTAELEEQVIAMGGHQAAAEEHEAAIDRVRALHERREGDDGSTYCDVCSNHGDVTWPCATIAALEGQEATK